MRTLKNALLLVVTLAAGMSAWAVQGQALNLEQTIDHIFARENQLTATLRQYNPIIETYVQDMRQDTTLGMVPATDHYFLGQANMSQNAVRLPSNSPAAAEQQQPKKKGWFKGKSDEDQKKGGLSESFPKMTAPDGFMQMIYVDPRGFDRAHYKLSYVRREYLGDVRCLVFDVYPTDKDVRDRFLGRIWAEDQEYTIVRFDGTNAPDNPKGLRPHFDSWRVSAGPGLWVPAYVYSAEAEMSDLLWTRVRFRAQTRLWGYNAKVETEADRSPEESERARSREAEGNAVDRLEASGLLAPSGQLDKILLTVANNLEVSNNLDIDPEVKCRVLLTSTLESFTIGHTIIVSRGLLDVLPDEASLATVLAHELGHVATGHVMGDQWAFSNWSIFPKDGKFTHFDYPIDPAGEQAANVKAMEILKKSPYKDKLATAGAFLQLIDTQSKTLPNLVSPHLESRAVLASQLISSSPHAAAVSAKGPEIVALPIGSRVKMDPWSNQVDMMKTKPVALVEGAEKQPFQISPFMPFLSRANTAGGKKQVSQQKADEPPKQ